MGRIVSIWITCALYLILLSILLLWPLNFDFNINKNFARLMDDGNGLEFRKRGQVISKVLQRDFYNKLTTGSGLTVEVWIKPCHYDQKGPARIFSYSHNTLFRNFTLAQSDNNLIMRLRTTGTDLNGMKPYIEVPDVFHKTPGHKNGQHIVFTYNFDKVRVYINGISHHVESTLKGDFRSWNPNYRLVIGNEVTGDRPWLGEIYLAAVYNRALKAEEIEYNFYQGRSNRLKVPGNQDRPTPLALYVFNTKEGRAVLDKAEHTSPNNLYIPKTIPPFPFEMPMRHFWKEFSALNLFWNISVFIPLGLLVFGTIKKFRASNKLVLLTIILSCALFIYGIEFFQYYLPEKHASIPELGFKYIGFFLGMLLGRSTVLKDKI